MGGERLGGGGNVYSGGGRRVMSAEQRRAERRDAAEQARADATARSRLDTSGGYRAETSAETRRSYTGSAHEAYQKRKGGLKKGLIIATASLMLVAGGIGLGLGIAHHNQAPAADAGDTYAPPADTETIDSSFDSSFDSFEDVDYLANGVHYDYSHYLDYGNKTTTKAYDYDMSSCFNDEERTIEGINEIADRTPEALASYAYGLFNKEEKQALGIDGMTMTQIDEYMSDENNQGGGEKQSALLAKLNEVLRDDSTTFRFYYENGTEDSNYINWVDANQDGIMTPDEAILGYSRRQRNHAPQVDIYRDGQKVLDLNMLCGFQPNYEINETPSDLPEFPTDPGDHGDDGGGTPTIIPDTPPKEQEQPQDGGGTPTIIPDTPPKEQEQPQDGGGDPTPTPNPNPTPTPTPTPNPEPTPTPAPTPAPTPPPENNRGKSGDPHGNGDLNNQSEAPDKGSEVSRDQSENANKDNQGYVNDGHALPGSSGNNNSTPAPAGTGAGRNTVTATGAESSTDKLTGGENQGATQSNSNPTAGTNAAQAGIFGGGIDYGGANKRSSEGAAAEQAAAARTQEALNQAIQQDQSGNAAQSAAQADANAARAANPENNSTSTTTSSTPASTPSTPASTTAGTSVEANNTTGPGAQTDATGASTTASTSSESPAGQNNYSDAQEEAAIASGDF